MNTSELNFKDCPRCKIPLSKANYYLRCNNCVIPLLIDSMGDKTSFIYINDSDPFFRNWTYLINSSVFRIIQHENYLIVSYLSKSQDEMKIILSNIPPLYSLKEKEINNYIEELILFS
jgi:hypothetical protein